MTRRLRGSCQRGEDEKGRDDKGRDGKGRDDTGVGDEGATAAWVSKVARRVCTHIWR